MFVILNDCGWCGNLEERTWTDSWTGMKLCNECMSRVAYHLTNSPGNEGDNLPIELLARAGDLRGEYDAEELSVGNEDEEEHSFG